MIKSNFHTHTFRCNHAQGDVEDYIQEAKKAGLQILGFSDHSPWPDERWQESRMKMKELKDYTEKVKEAQEKHPDLRIHLGLEVEYVPEYVSFIEDEFLGKYAMEYLVLGVHYFQANKEWVSSHNSWKGKQELIAYADNLIRGMRTGLYDYVAHPDLFGYFYENWDSEAENISLDMCQAALDLDIPFEVNGLGFRKGMVRTSQENRHPYPWQPFWEIVSRTGVRVIVNSDAHFPADIVANMEDGINFARILGIEVEEFRIK